MEAAKVAAEEAAKAAKAEKEGKSYQKKTVDPNQPVPDHLRGLLPPLVADNIIGFMHGHERGPHESNWYQWNRLVEERRVWRKNDCSKKIARFFRKLVAKKRLLRQLRKRKHEGESDSEEQPSKILHLDQGLQGETRLEEDERKH